MLLPVPLAVALPSIAFVPERVIPGVGPADVGTRISVRRRLAPRAGRAVYGDVVGELVSWGGGRVVVRRRDGRLVELDEHSIVAGRRVPPSAYGIADIALEERAALGWQPVEQHRLGSWRLRASAGFTGRANSVLPLGDPGQPVESALAATRRWYAARGLPAMFQLPLPVAAELDAELERRGWPAYNPTLVLTADPVAVAAAGARAPGGAPLGRVVELADEPDAEWLARYHYRGSTLPAVAGRLLVSAPEQVFASVHADGAVVAIGRGAIGAGWVGITAMEVAPAARRQGLGRLVLAALCRWGADRGATGGYLQVAADNAAGLGLYSGCGFRPHHRYHYRREP